MSHKNPCHLERGWKEFESRVVPVTASSIQREAMRDGFYAGALVAFRTLTVEVSDGDEITEADVHLMADIDAELQAFKRELDRRAAAFVERRGREG